MKKHFIKLKTIAALICVYSTNFLSAKLFILIGPSGVGKSTLLQKLHQQNIPLEHLVTCTTRPIRNTEKDGRDYFFLSKEEYNEKLNNNELLTSSTIYGNSYGILKKYVNSKLESNCNLVCCLTAETAHFIKDILSESTTTIFIAPPSLDELRKRLERRNTENESSLKNRLAAATDEMKEQDNFDFKIVNDDLDLAAEALSRIFLQRTQV